MEFKLMITKKQRKEAANLIAHVSEFECVYAGAPTFNYQIGGFILTKDCVLIIDDCMDNELAETVLDELADADIRIQLENHTENEVAESVENEMDEPDSMETETEEAEPEDTVLEEVEPEEAEPEGTETEETEPEETEPEETESNETNENQMVELPLTLKIPEENFDEKTFKNLDQIIENRRELFCHALKTDSLEYIRENGVILFPWFTIETSDDAEAYSTFITTLCKMASEQHRVINKPCVAENEKYAMRCFLIRMNLIGAEYKNVRKVMLRNLEGNSAFKNGRKAETENA